MHCKSANPPNWGLKKKKNRGLAGKGMNDDDDVKLRF